MWGDSYKNLNNLGGVSSVVSAGRFWEGAWGGEACGVRRTKRTVCSFCLGNAANRSEVMLLFKNFLCFISLRSR